jgi:CHAD domain-containing protein
VLEPRRIQVPPTYVLPTLDLDGLSSARAGTDERRLALHDTERLDLTRSDVRVAHEPGHGWLVELPAGPKLDRTAVRLSGGPTVPARVARLVRALTGDRPLRRLVRLDVRSSPLLLVAAGEDEPAVVVADEEVSVHEGRRLVARFREVVVRPGSGASAPLLDDLVRRLVATGGVALAPGSSRLVDVLGPRAAAPPDVVAPSGPLDEDATVRTLLSAALAAGVRAVERTDPHARLGRDPEGVHQLRVALRRLRAQLRTWRRQLDEDWTTAVRADLGWVRDALGEVRDLDVLGGRVAATLDELGVPDPPRAAVLAALAERRHGPERDLARVLDDDRYQRVLDALRQAALDPPLDPTVASKPAAEVLPGLVARSYDHLASEVAELGSEPDDEALHLVRRRARRLRDVTEAGAEVVGKPARRLADAAETAQDVLGEHQDAVVAITVLGELAAAHPDLAFTCGQLAGVEHGRATAARQRWPEAWAALDRRKLRRWTDPSG